MSEQKIKAMISKEEVTEKIMQMAEALNKEYQGRTLHLICILKGSVFFMCELAKYLTIPVTIDFMQVSSYGDGMVSSGTIEVKLELSETLEGKDVLIVEDIIDTGRTLRYLCDKFAEQNPASLKVCTLLDKPTNRKSGFIEADYTGFVIEDKFVVGYGLDYAQKYRNLPYIGVIE